ncbi:hypothetical protein [Saccharopolyspora sp. NPDC050642]
MSLADEEFGIAANKLTSVLEVLTELFPSHDYEPLRARLAERL